MSPSQIGIVLLLLSVSSVGSRDCRYYRNCGQYSREAYDVTYAYPGDHWTFEKEYRGLKGPSLTYRDKHTDISYQPPVKSDTERIVRIGNREVPLPARIVEGLADNGKANQPDEMNSPFIEEYPHAVAPSYNGSLIKFDDVFPLSTKIYSYVTDLEDQDGKSYRLRVEWAGYYDVKRRNVFNFLKKRQHVHYVKVTINGRLLFLIDDSVDRGAYDYEDYFRLGDKKFRVLIQMQTNFEDYYFGMNLVSVI